MNAKGWLKRSGKFGPIPAFPSRSSREPNRLGSEDMSEHVMNKQPVLTIAERHLIVANNKRAAAESNKKQCRGSR